MSGIKDAKNGNGYNAEEAWAHRQNQEALDKLKDKPAKAPSCGDKSSCGDKCKGGDKSGACQKKAGCPKCAANAKK